MNGGKAVRNNRCKAAFLTPVAVGTQGLESHETPMDEE